MPPHEPLRSLRPALSPRHPARARRHRTQRLRRDRRGAVPHLRLRLRQRRAGRGDVRRHRSSTTSIPASPTRPWRCWKQRLALLEGRGGVPRHRDRHGRGARRDADASEAPATGWWRLARAVRLLPLDRLDPAAALRDRGRVRRWRRPRPVARGAAPADAARAAGNPVQPDAGDRRPAGGLRHWRTTPARSWWWTTCSPRRCCSSRCDSAPMSWCIPAPSTSTARAACSAAPCWARAEMGRGHAAAVHPQHRPRAVAVQRLAAAEGAGDAAAAGGGGFVRSAARDRRFPRRRSRASRACCIPTRADHPQHALAMAQMSGGGTLVTLRACGRQGGGVPRDERAPADPRSPTTSAIPNR